jgi:hypothetical protein
MRFESPVMAYLYPAGRGASNHRCSEFVVELCSFVVQSGAPHEGRTSMARPRGAQPRKRLSISLDARNHAILERLAAEHDVSIARIARQAIAEFIQRQAGDQAELPLLRREAADARRSG